MKIFMIRYTNEEHHSGEQIKCLTTEMEGCIEYNRLLLVLGSYGGLSCISLEEISLNDKLTPKQLVMACLGRQNYIKKARLILQERDCAHAVNKGIKL